MLVHTLLCICLIVMYVEENYASELACVYKHHVNIQKLHLACDIAMETSITSGSVDVECPKSLLCFLNFIYPFHFSIPLPPGRNFLL